jgi:hypothetical protein
MQMQAAHYLYRLLIALLLVSAAAACAQTQSQESNAISKAGQGQFTLASEEIGELSGITYFGTDLFAVVSDKGGKLGMATIKIDRETGEITSASIGQIMELEGGRDIEDLAIDPSTCFLLTVDEADQSISLHHFPTGKRAKAIDVPAVFKKARSNLSFESVSASLGDGSIWAANEEPLAVDGPRATKDIGGLIRLQQFNSILEPTRQFAYRVDPHRGSDNIIERAQSGVSGLVALPSGGLIVMERELGGEVLPTFRIRLYLIDTKDATDTSGIDALADRRDVKPVTKELLYEFNAGPANFEGITLGPRLEDGDYALILVSDDGGKYNPQNLLSLRISRGMVEPAADDLSPSSDE